MAGLSDIFNKLRNIIVKSDSDETHKTLDRLQSKLDAINIHSGSSTLADLFSGFDENAKTALSEIVKDIEPTGLIQIESARLGRYALYDSIYRMIPYAKRAVKVITANILSPNDITKVYFKIGLTEASSDEDKNLAAILNNCRVISRATKLDKLVRRIIRNTLKYGDYFIWIKDSRDVIKQIGKINNDNVLIEVFSHDNLSSANQNNVLLEADNNNSNNNSSSSSTKTAKDLAKEIIYNKDINNNSVPSNDNEYNLSTSIEHIKNRLGEVYLEPLKPQRVISLTYESTCFGYLIIPDRYELLDAMLNPISPRKTTRHVAEKIIDLIINQFNINPRLKNQVTGELAQLISRLYDVKKDSSNIGGPIDVIYVKPQHIQHFKLQSDKYDPYGESIFSSIELDAKILVALKTALASWRISSSVEKRVVAVEVGLPQRAAEVVEKVKQTLRQRKITIDAFGTLDMIPSSISTFEVLYTPMKDGKRYIEFDAQSPTVDVGSKAEELKNFRDSVISGLGIPPAFLGVDEVEKKATLSYQNVLFTRDIIDYQAEFTDQFNELIKKLYRTIVPVNNDYNYLDLITIQFQVPKNLQIEVTSQLISTVTSTISSLKELGISQKYLVEEFLGPLIDLEEAEKYKEDESLSSQSNQQQSEMGTTGGGAGGDMGGF